MRELIYDHAGGIPDGRKLKAVIPGGSSVPALSPDQIDVPLDYDSLGRAEDVLRRRIADRRRRPLLHGAARPALDAVLHARVVRQVHAVPRGDALDGADPREDRARRRRAVRPRRCSSRSTAGSSARCCARSASSPSTRSRATSRSGATSSSRTSSRAAARTAASRRSRGSSRRASSTTTRRREPLEVCSHEQPELVTITIDDVEIQVPKGTGLVEAALYAGIEIPVFCYEPRLGPPVGACRMCLCEVAPGPPKPQAACTLTAADGMVVKTARDLRDGRRGAGRRRSSSSSSTTRSTARSATRAASARCRT